MDLNGAAAIVTGSATGIGAATAAMLAARGCNVVINYTKSEAEAEATVAECERLGAGALLHRADVSVDADCRAMVRAAVDRWGRLDILVNNAGATRPCPHDDLEGLSAADFHYVYGVNTVGPYQMARAAAPHLKAAGQGAIVNVSAGAAMTGRGSSIAYAASKGALNTMTISLARVLAPEIRVNTVCPSLVEGRWMRAVLGDEGYDATVARTREVSALNKTNTPDDVAAAVLWLIEGAGTMTGEVLGMDGGMHLIRVM